MLHIVQYRPVAGHDTLGYTGRTGSKDDINGIGVDLRIPDPSKRSIIRIAKSNVLIAVDLAAVGHFFCHGLGSLVADHCTGLQRLEDQLDAVTGHFFIQRDIVIAAVNGAKKGRNGLGVLLHKHHNGLLIKALPAQKSADGAGLIVNLLKGQTGFLVAKCHLVRQAQDGTLQIFQNIGLHG